MAHTPSPLGQFAGIQPAGSDPPDVRDDLAIVIAQIEKKTNLVFTNRAARDSAMTGTDPITGIALTPQDGQECYYTTSPDAGQIDRRIGGAWVRVYPATYSGTAAPSNALGVDGDVYVQYT